MSSPVQIDHDRRAMYAPPWARGEARDDETRRIQAEIVATAERLSAQPRPARQGHPSPDDGVADANSPPLGHQFDIEDAIREAWVSSRLDPVRMPPPPKPGGPTWGMLSRLTGAAGFAAVVALFVTGVIPLPQITVSVSREDNAAQSGELPRAPLAGKQVAALPASTATPPQAAPARPSPPSTVGTASRAPVNPEIESFLKRGHDLLASGDINGGRLLLMRAAEAGEARASYALGNSYDAALMGYLGISGVAPDPVKARDWYTKAAAQGSQEASRRLERMVAR